MKTKMLSFAAVVAAFLCFGSANAQKTEKLFNGKDLSNWNFVVDGNTPAENVFSVGDGVIKIKGNPFGYMYTKEKYSNYTLHVEWRWPNGGEKANSGIFLLIAEPKNPFPNGIECQLQAGNAGDFVLLGGSDLIQFCERERPKFPIVRKHAESSEKPAGEWNEANVYVKDGKINVYINGVYQNTGWNKQKEGFIGLQSEGKEVEFRNVTITPW